MQLYPVTILVPISILILYDDDPGKLSRCIPKLRTTLREVSQVLPALISPRLPLQGNAMTATHFCHKIRNV